MYAQQLLRPRRITRQCFGSALACMGRLTSASLCCLQLKILTAWSSNDPAAVYYIVRIWKGAAPPATADTAADDSGTTTAKSLAFTGLTAGDRYWFRCVSVPVPALTACSQIYACLPGVLLCW